MSEVYLMKVTADWYPKFVLEGMVGIDEDTVDAPYASYSADARKELFAAAGRPAKRQQFFDNFVERMTKGDVVLIATGRAAEFNIRAIALVAGDYQFVGGVDWPRHRRAAQIRTLAKPIEFNKWAWAKRLEVLPGAKMGELMDILSPSLFCL